MTTPLELITAKSVVDVDRTDDPVVVTGGNDVSQIITNDTIDISTMEISDRLTVDEVINSLKRSVIEQEKERNWKKKTVSVSDLVGCCRKTFYAFQNADKYLDQVYPFSEIVTTVGNKIHDIIQSRISFHSVEEAFKQTILGFTISGRLDCMYNENVLIEIKTADAKVNQPKPEHLKQALIYHYILTTYMKRKINLIQILYVCRGKVSVQIFDIEPNEQMTGMTGPYIEGYLMELKNALATGNPPNMNSHYTNTSACIFCPYQIECKRSGKYKPIDM